MTYFWAPAISRTRNHLLLAQCTYLRKVRVTWKYEDHKQQGALSHKDQRATDSILYILYSQNTLLSLHMMLKDHLAGFRLNTTYSGAPPFRQHGLQLKVRTGPLQAYGVSSPYKEHWFLNCFFKKIKRSCTFTWGYIQPSRNNVEIQKPTRTDVSHTRTESFPIHSAYNRLRAVKASALQFYSPCFN